MKFVAYAHMLWLALIPILGSFAALTIDPNSYVLRIAGWIPGLVCLVVMFSRYQLPQNKIRAVFLVLMIPAEITTMLLMGNGSLKVFLLEAGFVSMFSMTASLTVLMILLRPSGMFGALVGCGFTSIVLFGLGAPILTHHLSNTNGPARLALLGVVCLTAIWNNFQIFLDDALASANQDRLTARLAGMLRRFSRHDCGISYTPFINEEVLAIAFPILWMILFWSPLGNLCAGLLD